MKPLQTLSAEHLKFEELCQGIDDFEPLPSPADVFPVPERDQEAEPGRGSFDPLLLAGLVSPF